MTSNEVQLHYCLKCLIVFHCVSYHCVIAAWIQNVGTQFHVPKCQTESIRAKIRALKNVSNSIFNISNLSHSSKLLTHHSIIFLCQIFRETFIKCLSLSLFCGSFYVNREYVKLSSVIVESI